MTLLDHTFIYESPPREQQMQALDHVREVYGIRRIWFDEKAHAMNVEYDASHLTVHDVAALLRTAGVALRENSASQHEAVAVNR
jgi:hypothetical protein